MRFTRPSISVGTARSAAATALVFGILAACTQSAPESATPAATRQPGPTPRIGVTGIALGQAPQNFLDAGEFAVMGEPDSAQSLPRHRYFLHNTVHRRVDKRNFAILWIKDIDPVTQFGIGHPEPRILPNRDCRDHRTSVHVDGCHGVIRRICDV